MMKNEVGRWNDESEPGVFHSSFIFHPSILPPNPHQPPAPMDGEMRCRKAYREHNNSATRKLNNDSSTYKTDG